MIRKCLLLTLCASLAPGVAFAEEDDFLADASLSLEEEKKPKQTFVPYSVTARVEDDRTCSNR